MTPKSFIWLAFTAFSLQLGFAQDFHQSYAITPGAQINIFNNIFSGNFTVRGYRGSQVEVLAYKKGPDSKSIEISEDKTNPGWIILQVRSSQFDPSKFPPGRAPQGGFPMPGGFPQRPKGLPGPPGGFPPGEFSPRVNDSGDNRVDFEIKVPKSMNSDSFLNLYCIRGNIEISNVSWNIRAHSDWGKVDVKDARGIIDANSANGVVRVELGSFKEISNFKFSSMNGEVIVKSPGNLDAQVYMKSDFGRIKTDFKLEQKETRYGNHIAEGKLGSGRQKLWISSRAGDVSLMKK